MEEEKLIDELELLQPEARMRKEVDNLRGGNQHCSLKTLLGAVTVIALVVAVALAFGEAHYARARTHDLEHRLLELENAYLNHKEISVSMELEGDSEGEMKTSEMEEPHQLISPSTKLNKRVRRWTSGHAPIPRCNCDPETERVNEMKQCCCYNRTNFYTKEELRKYDELLRLHAAGHFTACNPSDINIQGRLISGQKVALNLFKNTEKDIYIGNEEPWSKSPASRAAFDYKPLEHTLEIKQDGIYLLYVQIARVKFTFGHLEVNNVEWLRCQHRPATREYEDPSGSPLGRETCAMMGVRPLLAGDVLRVRNKEVGFAIVTQSHCTYWGIYKLA